MTLRVLWLKQNDLKTWKMLEILMDHQEMSDKDDKILNGIVDFIQMNKLLILSNDFTVTLTFGVSFRFVKTPPKMYVAWQW